MKSKLVVRLKSTLMLGWLRVQVLGERLLLRGRPPREMVPFYERAVHIYTSCYVELFGTYKRPRRLFQRLATVKHLVQVRPPPRSDAIVCQTHA